MLLSPLDGTLTLTFIVPSGYQHYQSRIPSFRLPRLYQHSMATWTNSFYNLLLAFFICICSSTQLKAEIFNENDDVSQFSQHFKPRVIRHSIGCLRVFAGNILKN